MPEVGLGLHYQVLPFPSRLSQPSQHALVPEFSAGSHWLYRVPSWLVLSRLSPMSTGEEWCVSELSLTGCRVLEKENPTSVSHCFPHNRISMALQSQPPSSNLHSSCLRQREHLGLREASGTSLRLHSLEQDQGKGPGKPLLQAGRIETDRSRSSPEMPWQS